MFDGAAVYTASEALDMLGDQQSLQVDEKNLSSDLNPIIENSKSRKEIVFIDSGVDNYQTIVDAIDSSKSIYLIDSNENGFDKMQNVLQGQSDVDAVHIIGHASAGQVVLGNSILNADTINSFSNTLQSIGNSLTPDGDLLFYGCNLAQGEQGKLLIQQIGNITQADIAASDDVTGKDGDWLLEVEKGIIEAKSLEVNHYDSNLVSLAGVSSSSGFVVESGTDLRAGQNAANTASNASDHTDGYKPYVVALERENLTTGSFDFYKQSITGTGFDESNSGVDNNNSPDITSNTTTVTASTSNPLNVYYIMATESTGRSTVRSITFDGEIVGVWFNMENIIEYSSVDKDGATYHTINQHGNGNKNAFSTEGLKTNWGTNITITSKPVVSGQSYKSDWFGVDTDSNTLYVGFNNNAKHGDIIRVFAKSGNNAPVAVDDTDSVNEDATVTKTSSQNDALNDDSDADGDTITVTQIKPSGGSNSAVSSGSSYNSSGTTVTGTYGQLTIGADGSYTYIANQAAADALDEGTGGNASDTVTDVFVYTISDGNGGTDTANITITITGVNDTPTAVNDFGAVTEDLTITITNDESGNLSGSYDTHDEHSGDILSNDTDPDASPTHTVTAVRIGSVAGSGTAGTVGSALTGTYGQLTLNANGSYSYTANQDAADALDVGDTVSDYFNYTMDDEHDDTSTAVIRIYILGANDTPVARDDQGLISEGSTLTVSNGDNANESGGTYDSTGEHTGDVIDTSLAGSQDTDADASASLVVSAIRTGRESAAAATFVDSKSVQSGITGGIAFNTDGTKMFVANVANDDVDEYTLSTGFDVSTASYDSNFSVASQDGGPNGIAFNTDGTKMFIAGKQTDSIYEYTLSTGFDVSTASYDSSFSIASQEGSVTDLAFNTDGTKMFIVGTDDDTVDEYNLSTGFDVSTASYVDGFSVQSQETVPTGLEFSADGKRMFITGNNGDDVTEYKLTTAFDVSTASHVGQFDVSSQETQASSIAFNAEGTKMFVLGFNGEDVNEYNLTSAFRVANDTGSVGSALIGAYGTLTMSSDGSYTYAANSSIEGLDSGESVYDYFTYTVDDQLNDNSTDTAELKITVLGAANTKPVARDDVGVILENGTLTVNDGDNANETSDSGTTYNATGEHSGDVINTSSTTHYDTDADGDTLIVTEVRTGNTEDAGTAGTIGSALTGTYGQLTLNANGSYTYVANQTAADELDDGDIVYDYFNYTVDDQTGATNDEDHGLITITVIGINDAPTAQDDEGVIAEGSTLTVANSANANVSGSYDATGEHSGDVIDTSSSSHTDSDADASASLSITHIKLSGGSNSTVASSSSYNSNGTQIVGTYGTLTIGADGSYTYAATTAAADALDTGEEGTDTFVYTLSDGTDIATANLTIKVLGDNDAPVARDDSGTIVEDGTLTVSDGAGNSTIAGASYVDSINLYILSGYSGGYPQDIKFNNDGTKMFVVGDSTDDIREYHLTTGFDISTASYDSLFSVASQDTNPRGLAFNNDGTKMFVAGWSNQRVFEYHLTTGFDISTASYDSNLSISSNAGGSNGLAFNSDGTKMFVNAANSSDEVVEYTLSTGFDVSTASYDSSFVTQSQDTSPQGLAFSNDGKKMFVAGDTGDDINEYTLSTGFDVSTASFVGSFDVSSQGTTPTGITFNNDGTKMFITDRSGSLGTHSVDEYTLTTPFSLVDVSGEHTGDVIDSSNTSTRDTDVDIETLTVTAVRLGSSEGSGTAGTVGSALTGTYGQLTLNSNGSYTYVANQTAADNLDAGDVATDTFNYTVSDGTATDTAVITITVIGINDAPSAQNDVGVIVEDGTLTVTNGSNATLTGDSYDATGENSGDLIDTSSSSHTDSDLDTSASLSITQIKKDGGSNSAVAVGSSYNSSGTQVTGTYGTLTIGADGSYTYAATADAADPLDVGESDTDVFVYTLSDGTATTTATLTITILGANDAPVARDDTGTINEGDTLTVNNDDNPSIVAGASFVDSFDSSSQEGTPTGLAFNNDGTKMFVVGFSSDAVNEYTLSTAFDVSTSSFVDAFSTSSQDGRATGIAFNNDGTKMFLTGFDGDDVNEYTLSTGFDVSTASFVDSFSVSSQEDSPSDLAFNSDGTKMFVVGVTGDDINEYTLSTGFDVSTASYDSNFSVASQDTEPTGLTFSTDGKKMFVIGNSGNDVNEYTLSTGFDVSTASFVDAFDVSGQEGNPRAIAFNNDGTKMFILGNGGNDVNEYTLTSPFSLVNISGEHSGDVIDTNSTTNYDTDVDVETLTVTAVRKGSSEGAGDAGTVGSALTGTYGQLTLNSNGSYTYVANQAAAEALDAGDVVTDSFNYTVSDGTDTDTAVITITVIGVNDAPTAQDDVGVINEDAEFSVLDGANKNETGGSFNASGEHSGDVINTTSASHVDSDADASASLTITSIKKTGGSESAVAIGSSYNSNGTQVTGTYGTLTIGANGSYNYSANLDAADGIADGESVTDVFVYTLSDGTATTTANITITILGANDNPTAQNDEGVINEGSTLTVENSDNANVSGSYDASGEHSGDVINTTSSSHKDSDPDTSNTLSITHIKLSGGSNSTVASGSSYNSSGTAVTGTYGTLTIGADGSYKYVANSNISGLGDGQSVTDTFVYTIKDNANATTTANIVIKVLGLDTEGSGNNNPVATNNTNSVDEDATISVTDGSTGVTGDVLTNDTDADGDTLTVSAIQNSSGTSGTLGSGLTGTYGTLTINADGSYSYVADQSAADDLDSGDQVTDVFTYTVSDGNGGQDTATITITITGVNDAPVAVDDTDAVLEDATITKTGAQDDVLNDDSDADDSASLSVFDISHSNGNTGSVSSGSTYNSSSTQIVGTYGTLNIGADGSYTYTADQSAADDLDAGDVVTDVFTYTLTDGTTSDNQTATLTITVTGINDTPVAQDDVGVIAEDSTLTVTNGANANVSGSYDATGEHSGDVIDTSSSSHEDSDADDSATLSVSQIRKDGGSDSSVSSGSSYDSSGTSVTGTYGTLTIGADGSYTYVADQAAADALDLNDSVDDVFTYTLTDGTTSTTANITITVKGINDDPVAVNDTDSVSEGGTVTKTGSQDDVLSDDTDADEDATLTVTAIQPSGGSSSNVSSGSTYQSSGTSVTGTYGTLTIGADGSYTYTADQSAADALDDTETATDTFTYTVTDENGATATATITITVNGSNDAPVARNDTGTVEEDATLTVSDGDNANAVSAATYVDAFDISSQEFNPQGFTFSNDGTKMFLTGNNGDDVNEYTLTTGFDVSTASFVDSFDISSQELGPRDLAFSADGTKMFVVGVIGDDVNEYTLSTAFDVSTSSFVDSFDISSQENSPTGLAFNNDGTKMFIAGNGGDDINEYTLTTGFDVSTASFVDSFDVSSQDTAPNGLTFNSDGTKMYVVGNQGNDINEYDLTLGFDVSTASFVGALDVSSQDSAPKAISFSHDGTKLFVLGTTNKSVFEYTLTTPFSLINVDAEHSGDVIDTSNTSSYDTDVDVETLTVTAVRTGSSEGSGTAGTVGSALTGTYGQLTLNANGSYTYVANQSAADDLDAGDIVYDYFNYTVSDGDATDIAVITITVVGVNDTPVAVDDTDSVNEDATVTKTGSQDDALYDDTDADDSDSLTVTAIAPSSGSTSTVSEGSTYASGGTTVTGTYGTLTIGADGSYTYTADQSAADDLDLNDTATDVFTYTVSDGANTTTATITITVTGINDDPVAQNDVGVILEDSTLTVANSANANVSGSYDATGEHSGDVIDTSSSSHTDSDPDDSATLTVTQIKKDGGSNSAVSSGSSYDSSGTSVTGTYGTLTIGADGSYSYAADQSAADDLDKDDQVTDVFTYTLSDGTETTTANITITVIGINDTPTAVNDTDSVTEDERVTKTAVQDDVLKDDSDVDDSAILTVSNISHTNGNSGTVSSSTTHLTGTTIVGTYGTLTIGSNGSYTYIADQDAADSIASGSSETDVFTYTVTDENGATATATLTITVNGSDNEVVGVNDTGAVDAGSTLSVTPDSAGLLSNDTDNGVAALSVGEASVTEIRTGRENRSGTSGTVGSTLTGTYGTLTLNSDGTYTYVANTDAAKAIAPADTKIDYFTYTISDGTSTDTAQLAITVTGINEAPTSTAPPTIRAVENQPIKFQTKIFFDDPDPKNNTYGQLTYSVSGLPSGLTINDNGRINGKLKEGTYTFTVTATDGGNLSTSQTFTIVVGKPPLKGEPPPPPVVLNKKTIETAIANKIVTFETPKTDNRVNDLEVRSSLASIVKEYTFNGGMKVIDVAVEDLNIDQSGRPGVNENTILGFAIGDDYRLNVKQYTGTLEDGSELPNWIRVDPATGQTIVQFPESVYSVDVKVIAIDTDNTTREINVTLDKNSVSRDTALKRDLEPFIDRSAALKTEVTVDEKGQIILESNDGSRDDVLNPNDSSNDDNQIGDPNNQSNLENAPVIPEIIEETPAQDNLALDNQNPELEEKVVKFASLQDQIDLEFDEHENYGDKILKVSG